MTQHFRKVLRQTLQVKFYDHGITTLVNDLTLAWGQVNRKIFTTSTVNECQSSLNIRLLIHAFYNYFVEQKFSLIFTILMPNSFFEKYTDNISHKLSPNWQYLLLFFSLFYSLKIRNVTYHIDLSYGPYNIDHYFYEFPVSIPIIFLINYLRIDCIFYCFSLYFILSKSKPSHII